MILAFFWRQRRLREHENACTSKRQLSKRNGKSVPGINGVHQQGQVDQFGWREVLPNPLPHLIGDARASHQSDRFGPLQRCTLGFVEKGRLAPYSNR